MSRGDITGTQEAQMNLAEFARWAIENGSFEGTGLDGADIQDKAEACGILEKTKYHPEEHGDNAVGATGGEDWYVFTPAFKSAERHSR
jgi:hypothetical protein